MLEGDGRQLIDGCEEEVWVESEGCKYYPVCSMGVDYAGPLPGMGSSVAICEARWRLDGGCYVGGLGVFLSPVRGTSWMGLCFGGLELVGGVGGGGEVGS